MADFLHIHGHLVAGDNTRHHALTRSPAAGERSSMSSEAVLRFMMDQAHTHRAGAATPLWFPDVPVDDLDRHFPSWQSDDVAATVMAAIAKRTVLSIDYASRTQTSIFTFSPHRIVRFRGSFCVRGMMRWIDGSAHGRTIRLSRIVSAGEAKDEIHLDAAHDKEWRERRTYRFRIPADLPASVRDMVSVDFGYDEIVVITAPKAYERFIVREMTRPRMVGEDGSEQRAFWELEADREA